MSGWHWDPLEDEIAEGLPAAAPRSWMLFVVILAALLLLWWLS